MTEEQLGFKENITDGFIQRTLEHDVPGLFEYLHAGARVLDVGCGTGSISLDVATAVAPGEVVGVDVMDDRISSAARLASDRGVKNATFEVSDANALRFPDNIYDVVYSHTVLHSLIDPSKALSEQKRVAKPGGWVIASGVRDWGFSPRYPACPALDRIHEAWISYHELLHKRYLSGKIIAGSQERQLAEFRYLDLRTARKCVRWFREAGLSDVQMQFTVKQFEFPGSEGMVPSLTLIPPRSEPDDPLWDVYRDMMAEGFIDEAAINQAAEEVVAWYSNPDAFNLVGLLFVAGKA
jgi:ubiquinone/menaquinone biosynthesis C-methylase UbiE